MSAAPFEVRRHKDKNYLAKNVHCELKFLQKYSNFSIYTFLNGTFYLKHFLVLSQCLDLHGSTCGGDAQLQDPVCHYGCQ